MNWPAPTVLPPPPPEPTTPPENSAERARLSAVPAAAWLALLGAGLLLAAAIAIVASNWNAIGQGLRVAGLAIGTLGLLGASERLRSLVPTTAGVIAHVGTYLTAFVGIAATSMFGFTWPLCILVGGLALVVATNWQAGRWRRVTMHLAQVVGLSLVATGAAALMSTTAGLVAIILSVCLLAAGAQRRSVMLALLAVASPALAALAEAGIGAGTLERAGLVGEPLGWSGPLVGLLAATVIGAIGRHRHNNTFVLMAAASPVIGIVTGLAASDASAVAWWTVPALALIAAELGLRVLPTERRGQTLDELLDVAAAATVVGLWLTPVLVSIGNWDTTTDGRWAIPVVFTAVAVALSVLRWHQRDARLVDLGIAGLAAAVVAMPVAFDAPTFVTAGFAVMATLGAAALSRRLSPLAIYGAALWAVVAVAAAGDPRSISATIGAAALLAGLGAIVVAARARLAATNGPLGWAEMTAATWAVALAATALWDGHGPAIALGSVAVMAMAIAITEPRHTIWGVAIVGTTGVIGFDAATSTGSLEPSYVVGWLAATATLVVAWAIRRSPLMAHAAASTAVISLATSAAWFEIAAVDFTVMTMLAVTALTGVAWTLGRTPLDAAALTAGGVLLMTTTFELHPAWASGAWVLIGFQIVVIGLAVDQRIISWAGLLVAAGGLVSWWETSGLHDWFVVAIEPADITVADLWSLALTIMAVVAGLVLRSTLQVNSWIAYSAALTIAGVWLTAAQLERDPVWAIPALITVGVVAVAAGGWRRLAAPLVGGTVLTVIGVFLATGSDLTAIPTWVWLTLGGGALIATAVLIERTGKPGSPDVRDLVSRWS